MNKQIAIDILEKEKAYMQQHAGKAQVEAFDMAICALRISEQETRDKVIERIIERIEEARQKYQRLCREQGESEDEVMNIHFRGIVKIIKEESIR